MRRLLVILFATSTLACNTAKWCYNHCPETVRDSIIYKETEKVVVRDTIIYIPGDTILMKDSVPCEDFIKEFGNTRTKVKVVVKDRILTVEVINGPIVAKAQLFDHYKTVYEKYVHSETHKGVVKKRHWLSFWESWAAIGVIVLFLIINIIKWLKKKGYRVGLTATPPFISITKIIG